MAASRLAVNNRPQTRSITRLLADAPVNPIIHPANHISTPAGATRELTPTEVVHVDNGPLRGRFHSGPLAVPPEVVKAEAGTQSNEGNDFGFDDVYGKFRHCAKGASGQVYDIRGVRAQLAEPVMLVCKITNCPLDCHGFSMASPEAPAEAFERVTREINILAGLDHAHIVHLHRWFQKGYTM
ncbi:hypothetical protein FRB93_005845 [Tulasnella sp. JGI-2019a]|nr:hypothetical protein FRB93_005845 [Tulasnella sp. JGI-2019a]